MAEHEGYGEEGYLPYIEIHIADAVQAPQRGRGIDVSGIGNIPDFSGSVPERTVGQEVEQVLLIGVPIVLKEPDL